MNWVTLLLDLFLVRTGVLKRLFWTAFSSSGWSSHLTGIQGYYLSHTHTPESKHKSCIPDSLGPLTDGGRGVEGGELALFWRLELWSSVAVCSAQEAVPWHASLDTPQGLVATFSPCGNCRTCPGLEYCAWVGQPERSHLRDLVVASR